VRGIRGAWSQHQLHVARQLDVARTVGVIGDPDASQLGVVFRRDDDLGACNDSGVAAAELCFIFGQGDFVGLRLAGNRKIAG
jgi:hypothetical protein